MNHASFSSFVVPVLPAIGLCNTFSFCAVPLLDDTLHDVSHLVGRHRIDDLLTIINDLRLILSIPLLGRALITISRVMSPIYTTVAVLDRNL